MNTVPMFRFQQKVQISKKGVKKCVRKFVLLPGTVYMSL